MTTSTFSGYGAHFDDASFRVNGLGVSTALAAIGMVKTADTGQINWATVTRPVAINTQAGYEIWRFNDTLQATAPLFLRIDYGVSGNVAWISHWITVGKGSNGSGTITSPLLASTQVAHVASPGVGAFTWYLSSADGATLVLLVAPASSTPGSRSAIVVERSRNPAGAATGTGVLVAYGFNPTTKIINYTTTGTNTIAAFPVAIPSSSPMASGGAAPMFPATVIDGALNVWQPRAVIFGNTTDMGQLTAITIPTFGTYLPTGFTTWDPAGIAAPAFAWS